jgi:hypothetical protein
MIYGWEGLIEIDGIGYQNATVMPRDLCPDKSQSIASSCPLSLIN